MFVYEFPFQFLVCGKAVCSLELIAWKCPIKKAVYVFCLAMRSFSIRKRFYSCSVALVIFASSISTLHLWPVSLLLCGSILKIAHNWNSSDSCIWMQWISTNRQILCTEWARQKACQKMRGRREKENERERGRESKKKAHALQCNAVRLERIRLWKYSFIVYFPFSWTVCIVYSAVCIPCHKSHKETELNLRDGVLYDCGCSYEQICVRLKCQSPRSIMLCVQCDNDTKCADIFFQRKTTTKLP